MEQQWRQLQHGVLGSQITTQRMVQERERLVQKFENYVLNLQKRTRRQYVSTGNDLESQNLHKRLNLLCEVCHKQFRSFATLQLHLQSERHYWKASQGFRMNLTTADALAWKEDGLAMLKKEPKRALLLLVKAGKVLANDGQNLEAERCLERAIAVLQREIEKCDMVERLREIRMKESTLEHKAYSFEITDSIRKKGSLAKSNSLESGDGSYASDRSENTKESSRQQRAKRARMDKLKLMYRHYETQRGTKDLYQTMLKCYGEYLNETYDFDNQIDTNCTPTQEALLKRDLVLTELADTERDYVNGLGVVNERIKPIFQSDDVTPVLKNALTTIFGNIEEIYQWHKSVFLEKLEDCLEEPELLGITFAKEEEAMSTMYAEYCQNKPNADDLLIKYEEEISRVYSAHFGNDKLHINDYLIKPVQRLMKYQLLLQNVVKYTKKAGEDSSHITEALEVMEAVPKRANDKMNVALIQHGMDKNLLDFELIFQNVVAEKMKALSVKAIPSSCVGLMKGVSFMALFIRLPQADVMDLRQDILEVTFGRSRGKPRKMRVFLFEEFLIFTDPVEREGRLPLFRFAMEGKTLRMGLTELVENDKLKFAIWFRKFKTSDIFICRAESISRKESWLQVLRDLISVQLGPKASIPREPKELARGRSQRPKTWSAEALVRQATFGHPREGTMSMRLKKSIERFVMEELFVGCSAPKDDDTSKAPYQRSQSFRESMYRNASTSQEADAEGDRSGADDAEESSSVHSDSSDGDSCDRDDNNNNDEVEEERDLDTSLRTDAAVQQHKLSVVWEGDLGLGNETNTTREAKDRDKTPLVKETIHEQDSSKANGSCHEFLPNGYIRVLPSGQTSVNSETESGNEIKTSSSIRKDDDSSDSRYEITTENSRRTETGPVLKPEVTYQRRRSFSSPAVFSNSDETEGEDVEEISEKILFSLNELPLYKVALAEAKYLLGSIHAMEKPGTAFQLFDSSLAMFFDVRELKTLVELNHSREDLLKRCTSLYQSLKADKFFAQNKGPENTEFFGYQGLYSLLAVYARVVQESQITWSIVLYSLAVTSATTESCWADAWKIFHKLAQLYRQQTSYGDAIDSLIDAHYIQLETGDLHGACRDLEMAFKTAVNARNVEKCARLESLADVVVENLSHCSMDTTCTTLPFFCNMSKALRTGDKAWFESNREELDTICSRFKNGEAAEIEKIFRQLRDSMETSRI